MPQMAPISWIFLFILFSFCFFLFNLINYFCFIKNKNMLTKKETSMSNTNFMNWKW